MATWNSLAFNVATWDAFLAWTQGFARRHGAHAWAACLEESLKAAPVDAGGQPPQRYHLHAYFVWTDDLGLSLRSLDSLHFETVRPRIDVCKGVGSAATFGAPRRAALHGLWYVSVHKKGTVKSATNYEPWQQYSPSMAWLGSLWDDKKLSHAAFLELSAQFRTGHAQRKRDADDVVRQERNALGLRFSVMFLLLVTCRGGFQHMGASHNAREFRG